MSDPTCTVEDCGRPCWDQAYICERHSEQLGADLTKVEHLIDELDVVRSRQAVTGDHGPHAASIDVPLPYDTRASDIAEATSGILTTWARLIAEERGIDDPDPIPAPDGPKCAAGIGCKHTSCVAIRAQRAQTPEAAAAMFISAHLSWLRHHPAGGDAYTELHDAVRALEQTVDTRPERLYLGPCGQRTDIDGDPLDQPCTRDLYARVGKDRATCPTCSAVHDVKARREWVMAQMATTKASAAQVSALCWTMLDKPVTTAMIRGFVRRKKLTAEGTTQDGRGRTVPAYVVGAVVDLLAATKANPAEEKEARREAAAVERDDKRARELRRPA